jgi:hypothetical protein
VMRSVEKIAGRHGIKLETEAIRQKS